MDTFKKRRLTLYQQLQGAGMFDALTCFHIAERYHTGTRKDGVTPAFQHQIEIGLFAMLLPDVRHREELLCIIALHDTPEDHGMAKSEVADIFAERVRAEYVSGGVWAMTKKWRGTVRPEAEMFAGMAAHEGASLAKGCDRQHNFLSMGGVFTPEKQVSYLDEGDRLFLPMLKQAKRNFPFQIRSYELLKFNLVTQMSLIRAGLAAMNLGKTED